jgi:predicted NUDIX family phosphoesterase/dephospho-CoA kinase
MTYLEAAEMVLGEVGHPLSAQEIVQEIRKRELIEISGLTPLHTMNARISVDIKRKGAESRFKRIARGRYALREQPGKEYIAKPHGKRIAGSERVLVFPSRELESLGHFHGIRKDYEKYYSGLLLCRQGLSPVKLMPRVEAETDSNYKQIVSYVMVKYRDALLRFTRGRISTVGDYLHGQYSIGFGGHAEARDWDLFNQEDCGYANSVKRELAEEIGIDPSDISPHNFRIVGFLNDDSTPLGRCHFAFIHMLELPILKFEKGEKSVNALQFIDIPDLADEFGGYEYWSKLCIQTYFGERLRFDCHVHVKTGFSLRENADYVLIVGYIGSGKTEACRLLEREFGYIQIPCSRILQDILGCESSTIIDRRKLQNLGFQFINQEGAHDRFAEAILDYMKAEQGQRFVLDGLRYVETLEALEYLLGKRITVIYIESTVDNLYQYYRLRESAESLVGFTEFLEIISHPVEGQTERFWPQSHITIYNHGSFDSFMNSLRELFMKELRG